jgi:hypothetical protein
LVPNKEKQLEDMAFAAAWGGSIPVMRRLFLEEGLPITADAAKAAAQSNQVRGASAAAGAPKCCSRLLIDVSYPRTQIAPVL